MMSVAQIYAISAEYANVKGKHEVSRPFVWKSGSCSTELKFKSFEKEKSITLRLVAQSYGRYDVCEKTRLYLNIAIVVSDKP